MRLLVVQLHRAFEELDAFSDDVCVAYVEQAGKQHAGLVMSWQLLGVVSLIGLGLVGLGLSGLGASLAHEAVGDRDSLVPGLVGMALLVPSGLVAGWSFFAMRDAGLRRAIRRRLQGARCGGCGYSLLGLAVVDGCVRCPECGAVESLAGRGLSAQDILSGRAEPDHGAP